MSKKQTIPKSDLGNRNPILVSLGLRRAGTGGGGGHKSRNAPRGGQCNVQAKYLEEYLAETEEDGAEEGGTASGVDATESQEDNWCATMRTKPPMFRKGTGRSYFYP